MGDNRDDSLDSRYPPSRAASAWSRSKISSAGRWSLSGRPTAARPTSSRGPGSARCAATASATATRRSRMSDVADIRPRQARPQAQGPAPVRARANPFEPRRATAMSGSNSSATGSLAWSSPRALYDRFPTSQKAIVAPLQCFGRARDLRRGRPRARRPGADPPRQAGPRRRRQPQRQCRRRRRRGADRRAAARRRHRRSRALHPPRLGAVPRPAKAARRSIPSRRCRNWPPARGRKPPVYEVVSRTGAHHAPSSPSASSVATLGEATAEGSSKQEAETAAATALLEQLQ